MACIRIFRFVPLVGPCVFALGIFHPLAVLRLLAHRFWLGFFGVLPPVTVKGQKLGAVLPLKDTRKGDKMLRFYMVEKAYWKAQVSTPFV